METTPRTSAKAVAAFWLGVLAANLGVVGVAADLPLLQGGALALWVPALFLAGRARQEVNRDAANRRGKGLAGWGIVLPPAVVLTALLVLPQVRDLREAAARRETAQRLRQIVLAMRAYAADNGGRLPPAVLRDSCGAAMCSWRVLLLPYLGHDDLYRRFKLDEPWNSPHNLRLLPEMPEVYAPPEAADAEAEPFATFCQVPFGSPTAFDGESGLRVPEDFPRGVERTILLIEAPKAVCWTQPEDYACWYEGWGGGVSRERKNFLFKPRRVQGFHVALGGGAVCWLTAHQKETFWEMIYRYKFEWGEPLGSNW